MSSIPSNLIKIMKNLKEIHFTIFYRFFFQLRRQFKNSFHNNYLICADVFSRTFHSNATNNILINSVLISNQFQYLRLTVELSTFFFFRVFRILSKTKLNGKFRNKNRSQIQSTKAYENVYQRSIIVINFSLVRLIETNLF